MRRLSRSLALVLGLGCLVSQASAADGPLNTLTSEEEKAGWKLLFDGKSTAGWRNYKKDTVSPGWKIVDGALTRAEKGAGDIITVGEYGAFELSLDYNIESGGNSGVMYHVAETGKTPWQTGPEIQVQDNEKGHDPQKAGWLYQFYSSDKDATKPAGQWNTLRIVITPEKCEHYMNGVKYFDYVKGSADWNARLEKSKFKAYPDFGKPTKGHICLQDHNNLVSYRNIKIRDLSGGNAVKSSEAPKTSAAPAKPVDTAKPKETVKANDTAKRSDTAKGEAAAEAPKATAQVTTHTTTARSFQPLRRLRSALNSLR